MPYSARHKRETRQRILESARRLFNSKGFAEVSIGEIMEDAGLTHGGFYRHFKDKGELYAEAVRRFLREEAPKRWQQSDELSSRKPRGQRIVDAGFLDGPFRRLRDLLPADRIALGRVARHRRE